MGFSILWRLGTEPCHVCYAYPCIAKQCVCISTLFFAVNEHKDLMIRRETAKLLCVCLKSFGNTWRKEIERLQEKFRFMSMDKELINIRKVLDEIPSSSAPIISFFISTKEVAIRRVFALIPTCSWNLRYTTNSVFHSIPIFVQNGRLCKYFCFRNAWMFPGILFIWNLIST